ncbi:hypothetical protein D1815_02325 [Aquimarina sp. AD1]|nr:hypothetical protein D1815_02325 [Aquimarina sp. AD1]RKN21710.1 hypothetical protein D7035_12465 [Aquimarina sp. AD1]
MLENQWFFAPALRIAKRCNKFKKMKFSKYSAILILFLVLSSFHKTEPITSDFLFQKWIYKDYINENLIYESNRKFKKGKSGIEFNKNGTILRKQNSGWCGTPPIEYETVSGTWRKISKSLLEVEYKSWNGLNKDTLEIIELTKSKLTLKPIYTLATE